MNAPIASRTGVEEKAHRESAGSAMSAAMVIALTRPIFSDRWPKIRPPAIAPRLATMTIQLTVRRIEIMLLLQEGRIEVLRAVAEQIEAHHQHDHVERPIPGAP